MAAIEGTKRGESGENLCIRMESVNRITMLPMVESSVQSGRNFCARLKELNAMTNWSMSMAENTIRRAVKVSRPFAKPIAQTLERPVRCVDGMLCKGLDFVESRVPAVKLPPEQFFTQLVAYLGSHSGAKTACLMLKPAVDSANKLRCRFWKYEDVLYEETDEELQQEDGRKE